MRDFMLRVVVVFASVWMFTAGATAERRVALVIGNAAYQQGSQLKNPRNDAEDVGLRLQTLGFDVFEGTDLTASGLNQILREFAGALLTADVALVFYAGHGVQIDDANYIVPVDARWDTAEELAKSAVSLDEIQAILRARPRLNLIFFDACRDNPFLNTRTLSRSGRQVRAGWATVGQQSVDTYISFASAPGEVASDGTGRNSPFTSALLQELASPADDVQSLMQRVRKTVLDVTGGRQTPWERSSLVTRFTFAAPDARSAQAFISAERTTYRLGDAVRLTITPPQDCRLTLLNVDNAGKSCLLFPHPKLNDQVLKAGVATVFPPRGALRLNETGQETFVAMCNASEGALAVARGNASLIDCSKGGADRAFNDKVFETVTFDLDDPGTPNQKPELQEVLRSSITVTVSE